MQDRTEDFSLNWPHGYVTDLNFPATYVAPTYASEDYHTFLINGKAISIPRYKGMFTTAHSTRIFNKPAPEKWVNIYYKNGYYEQGCSYKTKQKAWDNIATGSPNLKYVGTIQLD